MNMKIWFTVVLWVALFALAGCGSTGKVQEDATSGGASGHYSGAEGSGAQTSGMAAGGQWNGSPLDNPNSPLYEKTIYFDFDESYIRPEYVETLRAHAEYLINNPAAHLVIEGHCDERPDY